MRDELADLKDHVAEQGPYRPDDDQHSVFDICCPGFEAAEEDEPHVRSGPKLGRNDPCWCGSGKKYKKCHLASDEAR
ncbi:MAG: SEC-C domain-containing protein [Acidobacteria bacterium]|nr:SEC-C domain-containing protein [Acidobacteriota bacterium]